MEHRHSILSWLPILGMLFLCLLIGKFITVIPSLALLIIFSVFLFCFAFFYTNLAMAALIIAMLLSPQLTMGAVSRQQDIMVRIDDLLVVVFSLAWLARTAVIKNVRLVKEFPVNRWILFYCCCFIFSTLKGILLGNIVLLRGGFYIFKYIEYFLIFYLASGIIADKKQMVFYLKIFIIVFAIVNIYAFTQIGQVDRVSAPFQPKGSEPNTLGGYQVLLLGLIIGLLTHTKLGQWKWPLIALALFTMIPFGHTLSRASYIAFVPMYLTLIIFNKFTTKNILIVGFILGIAVFLILKPENIVHRLTETFIPEYQENIPTVNILGISLGASPSARINDWVDLFHQWMKAPFFGCGLTGARFVDGQYIKVLAETGLVGFAAFIVLIVTLFRQTLRIYSNTQDDLYKGLSIGFLAGQVGMIFHAISANTFIIIRIMEPYWFLAAMVMIIPKLEKPKAAVAKSPDPNGNYVRNVNFLLQSKSGTIAKNERGK
ncbi:MAG: hypothetical protein HQL12_06890 [Candidatus Omnitrophica bacterium]|nr:hypothetical protein [Candidatus Omnitrophota bacterium]